MVIGQAVKEIPDGDPDEPERARENERRLPAVFQCDASRHRHGQRVPERGSGVENAYGERPLAQGKPFRDGFDTRREIGRLHRRQQTAKELEAAYAGGKSVQHVSKRPARDEDQESAPRTQAINNPATDHVSHRVRPQKRGRYERIAVVVKIQGFLNRDFEHGKRIAIHVIQLRSEANQNRDVPAQVFDGPFWLVCHIQRPDKSVLDEAPYTSPVVERTRRSSILKKSRTKEKIKMSENIILKRAGEGEGLRVLADTIVFKQTDKALNADRHVRISEASTSPTAAPRSV